MPTKQTKTEEMIEELARSVAMGFLGVDKQLAELRGEIGYVKGDIDTMKSDIDTMKGDIGSLRCEMRSGFSAVHAKLAGIKEEIADIKTRLDAAKHFAKSNDDAILDVVFELQKRVKVLEKKIAAISR